MENVKIKAGYNLEIIKKIKKNHNVGEGMLINILSGMEKRKDVFDEFMTGMKGDVFTFPDKDPIVVEGYTAKDLCETYHMSEFIAYNYLVLLRENPNLALMLLNSINEKN